MLGHFIHYAKYEGVFDVSSCYSYAWQTVNDEDDTMRALTLWKKNPITGYWRAERQVSRETAQQWLAIFQSDEPNALFVVSARKPA